MPSKFGSPTLQNLNQLFAEADGIAITPSDSVDLPAGPGNAQTPNVGFFVTGAGAVNVDLPTGGTALFSGLSAGQRVDCAVKRIRATSTTATGIFACYASRPN